VTIGTHRTRTDAPEPQAVQVRAALADAFTAHVDVVFGHLVVRCGSRHLAEEITAETFAEAARAAAAGRVGDVERGWLLDVARKRLIDHWRREQRHRNRLERVMTDQIRLGPSVDGDAADGRILEALDALPSRQRAVLVLRYIDGSSVSEVATALEVTYQAAESLLARARRSLLAAYERTTPDE